MTRAQLTEQIKLKQSYLCIGLDPDLEKLPRQLLESENPVLEFCRQIIEATADLCVAYKPNLAFFEALGRTGWETFAQVRDLIPSSHFLIADAKRGDIGNTSGLYAKAFFEQLNCDAVTVSPFMGRDSVEPFLQHPGKWAVVLALTSNEGARDFQLLPLLGDDRNFIIQENPGKEFLQEQSFLYADMRSDLGEPLWECLLRKSKYWGNAGNLMYVVGATRPEQFEKARKLVPAHFLLVPGVGAQGGSLAEVSRFGLTADGGLLVNASRSILYASPSDDFATEARAEALKMQQQMADCLRKYAPGLSSVQ